MQQDNTSTPTDTNEAHGSSGQGTIATWLTNILSRTESASPAQQMADKVDDHTLQDIGLQRTLARHI